MLVTSTPYGPTGTGEEEKRSLRFDSQVVGKPQPWTVIDRGLELPGEVIVAETVDPAWGEPLEGDVCFRIVFYTVPRRIPAVQIRDQRIAMAVPRRSADPAQERLSRELQAIHEAKARYVTGRDPEIGAIRSSMEEQEASLLSELARREALSYSRGRVYTQSGILGRLPEVFAEARASSWVEYLVQAVFQQAYPTLPFDYNRFPHPLTTDGIGDVYRGVFQGDGDALETAAAFGPMLGLTKRRAPVLFDASECRVVAIIEEELGSRGGEMPTQDLLRQLGRDYGLNRPLAALYLLAFVRQSHAEVGLTAGHTIQRRQGGPFVSDRVSWDLVGELSFTASIADQLDVLRAQPSLVWNAVLPYASLLADELRLTRSVDETAEQEQLLVGSLREMGQRIEGSREAVKSLAIDLQEDPGAALTALDRLQVLSVASGYRGFHSVAVDSFGGPSGLGRALDLYNRVEELATLAPAITQARRYLDEMTFGRDHQELAVKCDSVVGRTGLDSLIANPSLWNSVQESFELLRREYASVYRSYHARYHEDSVELVVQLERLTPQVEALNQFNEVPEFGLPLGTDIPGRFGDLLASVRKCTASEDGIALEAAPICEECALRLDEDVPRREAMLLMRDTQRATRVYNRRLSSEGVRQILAHPTKEQLDKFINLVQVSDLTALANVFDEEVLQFLRRFMHSS